MRPLLAIALLATALAGCVSPGPAPGPGGEALPPGGTWRLDCGISNWAERCNARASPNESPSKTEIDIAVNPTDLRNVFVASKDLDPVASDCVWSVGQATKDGGRTWSTVYVGGTAQDRMLPDHPMFGWTCVTDPILAFDSGGTLYYPLQAYSLAPSTAPDAPLPFGGGSSFWLGVSRDGGLTFPTEDILLMAIADGGLVFHDYPRMAVSPATDSVSTVWNAVGVAGVNPYVVTTRDGGESVDPPTVVAFPDAPRTTQFASGFAADPDGSFYMTVLKATPQEFLGFFTGGQPPERVQPWLAVSDDDARTFPTFKPMFEATPIPSPLPNAEFRTFTAFELAADVGDGPRSGRLYAAWADYRNNNSDIFVSWTDDRGDTWSEHVQVTNSTHDQFMVRATISADGTLHLLYMDRQHDPGNKLIDMTHSWSEDGGMTWHHERLTSTSFDGDLGIHQSDFPFIGDYVGISSAGEHLWMGFPTTHTGRAEIGVAHSTRANATAQP